ncbi:MAG TPA: carboxypeptidase-like regulatory domain-containing protein [Arachidicoccus sp.]|nr:carboxypeptidase-like regulatory domain-containing protein [Arachidicoccus sp.]
MRSIQTLLVAAGLMFSSFSSNGQYVQAERDDTIRLYASTPFDSTVAIRALARGNSSIKGVAFTKPKTKFGYKAPLSKRIYANKIKIMLFPVTPYLLEYLELRKKENPKKLKFVYINPAASYYRYEAITNSVGEFTFPNLKPGRYYLEGILPWSQTSSYNQYTGSGYNGYGGVTDYYDRKYYNVAHYDKIAEFVEIQSEGQTVNIKLR